MNPASAGARGHVVARRLPLARNATTLLPPPCASIANRRGGSLHPGACRLFHQTSAQSLALGNVALGGLGVAAAIGSLGLVIKNISRKRQRSLVQEMARTNGTPPRSWLAQQDGELLEAFVDSLTANFNAALRYSGEERARALRDFTFKMPFEVSRLGSTAFELEDLGPLPPLPASGQEGNSNTSLFDSEKDTRVYLYFPEGSSTAPVVYLAVNADPFSSPGRDSAAAGESASPAVLGRQHVTDQACGAFFHALQSWKQSNPDIIKRIDPVMVTVVTVIRGRTDSHAFAVEENAFIDDAAHIVDFVKP